MLRMENASQEYVRRGTPLVALRDADLEINQGDFVSVIGASGSGKSTLLLILGGMLSPSKGRVMFEGQSLYELPVSDRARLRRDKVGYVFQTFNLIPYLTALQNVQVPLLLAGLRAADQQGRASHLLEQVGLADRLDHKPSELSVGQQQRVALARMLANEPEVILADEPTGNLDPETGEGIWSFFEQLHAEGRTIVLVTHDHAAARRAGRSLRLVEGSLQEIA